LSQPTFLTDKVCICVPIPPGSSCGLSRRSSLGTSSRPIRRAPIILFNRVLGLEPDAVEQQLKEVLENFEGRHRNLLKIFETRAAEMEDALEPHAVLTKTQRYLVGAYFLHEYSFEASALFNPSIVRHPDQSGAPDGGCRFI